MKELVIDATLQNLDDVLDFIGADEREVGGLGIFMVKKIMDAVECRHEEGKNILVIRKVVV